MVKTPVEPNDEHIEVMTRAHFILKPDDAKKLGKMTPGSGIRIVLMGEVNAIEKRKAFEDEKEYDGSVDVTVKEIRISPENNQFQALANEDE